jgi:UDP-4-amino-4,6-dideoxy-L-N-acetyl-beta-L-altrosamine transaminase
VRHGFNYRISDINCALGMSQLKRVNLFLKKRKKIYKKYVDELDNLSKNFSIPKYSKIIKPSFHLFQININFENIKKTKDDLMKYFVKNKVLAQQHYIPIYKFKIYNNIFGDYPGSDKFYKNSISIPIFVNLPIKNQVKVIKIIKNFIKSSINS